MIDNKVLDLRRCAFCGVWFWGPFLIDQKKRPIHPTCFAYLYPERLKGQS